MIDTNELRRLAQAAMHPVTKGRWIRLFGERTVYDRMEDGCRGIPVVSTPVSPPHPFEAACLDFIAAANPAAVIELLDRLDRLDRLEAAEAEALEQARLNGMGSEREAALKDITIKEEVIDSLATVIKRLDAQCDAAEKEREMDEERIADLMADLNRVGHEIDALRAKIARMEQQEPVGVLHVGSYYGEELQDWEFEANQCACDKLNEAYVRNPMSLPLYALPGAQAQPAKNAVAYLDLGTGGYMDVGTDLTDEELATLPKGRHMLGIIGTYGVDGYVPAQRAPDVWLPIPGKHPTFDPVDLQFSDGSVLCGCVPQADGDYWWEGPSGEVFIDPKYASVTHWRLAAAPEAKP